MAESMSLSPTLDPKSPYYLHSEMQPGNFSIPKLSEAEDNYVIWKLRFLNFLRLANKIGFIDGTLEKPEPSSPFYHPWEQCDSTVKCWLTNSMTEKLINSVVFAQTAHKMWEDLRRIFIPCVDLKIYQVRRRIAMMRQDGDSLAKYFGRLRKAWMELSECDPVPNCDCGGCQCDTAKRAHDAREKEKLYAFLMGLNNGLSYVKTQIMIMDPPPSLYKAYALVEQAESRR